MTKDEMLANFCSMCWPHVQALMAEAAALRAPEGGKDGRLRGIQEAFKAGQESMLATPPTPPPADLAPAPLDVDALLNAGCGRCGDENCFGACESVPAQAGEPTPVGRIKRSISSVEELCSTCCTAAWCDLAESCLAECLPEDADAPLRRQSTSGYAYHVPPVAQEPDK